MHPGQAGRRRSAGWPRCRPSPASARPSARCRAGARRARSTASRPSAASADHLDVVLGVEQRPEPAADQRPGRRPAGPGSCGVRDGTRASLGGGRQLGVHREPARRAAAPRRSRPPSAVTRSRIPISPKPGTGGCRRRRPVVVDAHGQRAAAVVDLAPTRSRRRRAGRRWSAPPGRRGRRPGRRRAAAAARRRGRSGRRQARRPGPLHQRREPVEPAAARRPSSRRSTSRVARSSRAASPLASWIASSASDGLLAVLAGQVRRDAGLHLDHRDAVGERVVQLARDPEPLLDRARRATSSRVRSASSARLSTSRMRACHCTDATTPNAAETSQPVP